MRRSTVLVGLWAAMALVAFEVWGQPPEESQSLGEQLRALSEASAKRLPPQLRETMRAATESVRASGIEKSAKQVGDRAIDAELTGWDGKTVQLSKLWSEGPVVLLWYRGGWCPYCNIQLRAMQQQLEALDGASARLVVLTPELPEKAKQTAEKNQLTLVALHDKNNELARQYGLVFQLPEPLVPFYRDRLKLAEYNGTDAMELPLAATYVIDRQGIIRYAFLDADYTKRAEPSEVLAAVKQAAQESEQ